MEKTTAFPPLVRASPAPLRVLLWAPISRGLSGGVEQYLAGIAEGFSMIQSETRRAWLLTLGAAEWLPPLLPVNDEVIVVEGTSHVPQSTFGLNRVTRGLISQIPVRTPAAPKEVTAWMPDLIHFPTQSAFTSNFPFVYQPHDLQHHHLPQNFTSRRDRSRRLMWDRWTQNATRVVVGSEYTARDVETRLGVAASRIDVVRYGVPIRRTPEELPSQGCGSDSPAEERYLLYPAAAWPHKNHEALFQALRALREEGLVVSLWLSGAQAGSVNLEELIREYDLGQQVKLLGYLDQDQYVAVLRGARGVIVPTLFENMSFPVWEAFTLSVPVACSDVCGIPEQTGDAALLFSPTDTRAIANAIRDIWCDEQVRQGLQERGRQRVAALSWGETAVDLDRAYLRAINDLRSR